MSVTLARPGLKRALLAGTAPAWVAAHPRSSYIIAVALSVPPWVDKRELALLQAWAAVMTLATGTRHVLDHIVPITHPKVCGLTVPWNLQVVPWRVNAAKGNRWCNLQLELF
jgi:hypothetical protein